jgi:hypothetical protein
VPGYKNISGGMYNNAPTTRQVNCNLFMYFIKKPAEKGKAKLEPYAE